MSIISDALRKAADKRREVIRLPDEELTRELVNREKKIRKFTSKRTRWSALSSIGVFFIVGFAILIFLYNTEFLTSFISPKQGSSMVMPKKIDFEQKIPSSLTAKPVGTIDEPSLKEEVPSFELTLNGVIEGAGEPVAVINNNILEKGDFIHGMQIIDITSNKVTLLNGDKELILRIK